MTRSPGRFCRSCGAAAPATGRFCPHCGSSLSITTPYPVPDHVRHDRDARDGASARTVVEVAAPASRAVVEPSVAGSVRMGFGIAAGMLLFAIVLAIAALLVLAITSGTITWPFAEQATRFDGTWSATSKPVTLDGRYRVEWSATPATPVACRFEAWLRAADGLAGDYQLASETIDPARNATPLARQLTVSASYTVEVASDCRWSIRFVRQ